MAGQYGMAGSVSLIRSPARLLDRAEGHDAACRKDQHADARRASRAAAIVSSLDRHVLSGRLCRPSTHRPLQLPLESKYQRWMVVGGWSDGWREELASDGGRMSEGASRGGSRPVCRTRGPPAERPCPRVRPRASRRTGVHSLGAACARPGAAHAARGPCASRVRSRSSNR